MPQQKSKSAGPARRCVFALALLLLSACSGGHSPAPLGEQAAHSAQPVVAVPLASAALAAGAFPHLPSPVALAKVLPAPRHTSYVEADLEKDGALFNDSLPFHLAAAVGADCSFSPASSALGGLSGAAYCIYDFSAPGYDRNPQLRLNWASPVPAGSVWLALANWDAQRWDWYSGSGQPALSLASLDPYFDAGGHLALAVLVRNSASLSLRSLRLGAHPPLPALTLSPASGMAPFVCTCDASGSSDPDGSLVKYEWDFNGNGSFEVDSGAKATQQHSFPAGLHEVGVRVTDSFGISATATATATSIGSWQHTYGGLNDEGCSRVLFDGHSAIYAAGNSALGDSSHHAMALLKFDLAGKPLWQRLWQGGPDDYPFDMALDGDGNIVLIIQDLMGGQSTVLQQWSPDGALLLSQYYAPPPQLLPEALVVRGESAYLCGMTASSDGVYLLKFDLAGGGQQWVHSWPLGGVALVNDMVLAESADPAAVRLYAALDLLNAGGRGVAMSWDLDGQLKTARILDSGDLSSASAIAVSSSAPPVVTVAGSLATGQEHLLFLSSYLQPASLNSVWKREASRLYPTALLGTAEGGFALVCPSNQAAEDMLLSRFDAAGQLLSSTYLGPPGHGFPTALAPVLGQGLLICGFWRGLATANWVPDHSLEVAPTVLSWSDLTLSEGTSAAYAAGDFPGIQPIPQGNQFDYLASDHLDDCYIRLQPMP